jgi:hypothetical protein
MAEKMALGPRATVRLGIIRAASRIALNPIASAPPNDALYSKTIETRKDGAAEERRPSIPLCRLYHHGFC